MLRLPEDVIPDILVGLPVKDLVRFRCISKSLCATIDSPDFIAAHLNRSRQTKSRRNLVFLGTLHSLEEYNYNGIDLDDDEIHKGIQLNNPLEDHQGINNNNNNNSYSFNVNKILASCNGSLLLYDETPESGSVLWNPFTRRWKTVPLRGYGHRSGIGFGYDSATNDYKVVSIGQRLPSCIRVQVFHVASNTLTEKVIPFPDDIINISSVGLFAKGALHWIIKCPGYQEIFSFDVSRQVFVKMFPPLPSASGWNHSFFMQVLEDDILLGEREEHGKFVDLFGVVPDSIDGEGFAWRKLYTINLMRLSRMICARNRKILEDVKLLEYSKDGKKILLQYPASGCNSMKSSYLRHLFWYDFRKGKFTRVRISHHSTLRSLRSRGEAIFCLGSLISLGADSKFDGGLPHLRIHGNKDSNPSPERSITDAPTIEPNTQLATQLEGGEMPRENSAYEMLREKPSSFWKWKGIM